MNATTSTDPRDTQTFADGSTQTLADCQGCGVPVWGQQVKNSHGEFHLCYVCHDIYRKERATFETSKAAVKAGRASWIDADCR